jgi:Flp pilus assembly protein TadG
MIEPVSSSLPERGPTRASTQGVGRRLLSDDAGIAAVEFALILPLIMLIYVGLSEVSRMIVISQRVSRIAHVLADLTSQKLSGGTEDPREQAAITDSDRSEILEAGRTLLLPDATSVSGEQRLLMTVSEVMLTKNASGASVAKVQWSFAGGASYARPCVDLTTTAADEAKRIAPGFTATGSQPVYIIVADVAYKYFPLIRFELPTLVAGVSTRFSRTAYAPVRNSYIPAHIQWRLTGSGVSARNCNAPRP